MVTNTPVPVVNLAEKFGLLATHWQPKVIAELNDYQFKLVLILGEFVWHTHRDTDEAFLVLDGELAIEFRDHKVVLKAGELCVVPRGVEHRPVAQSEVKAMLIEPRGVVNTGDKTSELTAQGDVWI